MKVYVLMVGYESELVRVFTTHAALDEAVKSSDYTLIAEEECELEGEFPSEPEHGQNLP